MDPMVTDKNNDQSNKYDIDVFSVVNTNIFSWRSLKYLLYSPHWMARSFLYLVSIVLLVGFMFMIFFDVDIVISGRGRIVPSQTPVKLQSDSVKRVKRIAVKLDQPVKKNDILVEFENNSKQRFARSPVNGRIIDIYVSSPGEVLSIGDPIVEIVPSGSNKVARILIREEDITKIKVGDKVKVKLDAFPFRKYGLLDGSIYWIAQKPTGEKDNFYPILTSLEISGKFKLLYGMQLTGEIIVRKIKLYKKVISEIFLQGQEF